MKITQETVLHEQLDRMGIKAKIGEGKIKELTIYVRKPYPDHKSCMGFPIPDPTVDHLKELAQLINETLAAIEGAA